MAKKTTASSERRRWSSATAKRGSDRPPTRVAVMMPKAITTVKKMSETIPEARDRYQSTGVVSAII